MTYRFNDMKVMVKIETDSMLVTIDSFGGSCSVVCVAVFVDGKCSKIVIADMKNIEDYVKRY